MDTYRAMLEPLGLSLEDILNQFVVTLNSGQRQALALLIAHRPYDTGRAHCRPGPTLQRDRDTPHGRNRTRKAPRHADGHPQLEIASMYGKKCSFIMRITIYIHNYNTMHK